jgi:hypothetical protein
VAGIEQKGADLLPDRGPPRLADLSHIEAAPAEVIGNEPGLGGLSRALRPFQGEEDPPRGTRGAPAR